MGLSTNGILVLGVDLAEECPEFLEEFGDDFDIWLEVQLGVENMEYSERSKIIDACPVEMIIYSSYEYPMYILAVRGTCQTVHRGYVIEVSIEQMQEQEKLVDAWGKWCQAHDIGAGLGAPKWLLVSMMG